MYRKLGCRSGPKVIKLFFMLNSVEKEICSGYKKLNTSNLHSRTKHEIFPANKYLLAGKISCSTDLNMEKAL